MFWQSGKWRYSTPAVKLGCTITTVYPISVQSYKHLFYINFSAVAASTLNQPQNSELTAAGIENIRVDFYVVKVGPVNVADGTGVCVCSIILSNNSWIDVERPLDEHKLRHCCSNKDGSRGGLDPSRGESGGVQGFVTPLFDAIQFNTNDVVRSSIQSHPQQQHSNDKISVQSNFSCLRIFSFLGKNRQNHDFDEKNDIISAHRRSRDFRLGGALHSLISPHCLIFWWRFLSSSYMSHIG